MNTLYDNMMSDERVNPKTPDNRLPCHACDGVCCEPIRLTLETASALYNKHNMDFKYGPLFGLDIEPTDMPNEYIFKNPMVPTDCLFKEGSNCTIYEDRPVGCRLYGETKFTPCPYAGLSEQPKEPDRTILLHQQNYGARTRSDELLENMLRFYKEDGTPR